MENLLAKHSLVTMMQPRRPKIVVEITQVFTVKKNCQCTAVVGWSKQSVSRPFRVSSTGGKLPTQAVFLPPHRLYHYIIARILHCTIILEINAHLN